MLATTIKPYNPNKKQSLDADWDKLDLCSFLDNINSINIDKNDISYTGNDYEKATKREIVAEIIRTMNATHYNSLLGMKDIINYNNKILKITDGRNKSIAICNKSIKLLNARIKRIEILLVQAADILPDPQSIAQQQTTQQMKKIGNILDFTSCIDVNVTDDDFKQIQLNQIPTVQSSPKQPQPQKIKRELNDIISGDIKDSIIEPTQNELLIEPQLNKTQLNEPQLNLRSKIKNKINESQIKLITTQDLISSQIKPKLTHIITDVSNKQYESSKEQYVDESELKQSQVIKSNKAKNKNNKKNKNKNKYKHKNRKQKHKQKRHQKKQPNIKQEKIMLSINQMDELIQIYEFTDDNYQEWINQRHFHRSGLSAYEYYQEIYGTISDEKIKEWVKLLSNSKSKSK